MRKLSHGFIMIMLFLCITGKIGLSQECSFTGIHENLLFHRPQSGDPQLRKNSFMCIDELVMNQVGGQKEKTSWFYQLMLEKAMLEIRTEKVDSGVTIWQIYNHGFVVKTPSVLMGFDLYDFYGTANLQQLAGQMDIMFISHGHKDHLCPELESAMIRLDKPVISYISLSLHDSTIINLGDSIHELPLRIVQHTGLHSDAIQMFEVVTPEGIRIFHTGDNQTSETIPELKNIDILLLNAWVNESGWTTWIEGSRNAINKIKPKVTIPGHILELGHLGDSYIVPYGDVYLVNEIDLGCEYHVLAWGERYHFNASSNDTIRANLVYSPRVITTNDSVIISWDPPPPAADGDTASFYRIVREKSGEFFTTARETRFRWDTIGNYKVKIFSYDDCGNQCHDPVDLNVTIPDINYPPRIERCYPSIEDTTEVYSGVHKVFQIMASDPNHDPLAFNWELDGNHVQTGAVNWMIYQYSGLDTGIHRVTVTVSDQVLDSKISWLINHNSTVAIIDNSDTLMYSESGNWNSYQNVTAISGSLRFSYLTNIGNWACYSYFPEIPGYYDASIFIPDVQNGSSLAIYYIFIDEEPVDTIPVDQYTSRNQWIELGRYFLPDSSLVQIRVVNTGRAKKGVSLLADAVRFIYNEGPVSVRINKSVIANGYSFLRCTPNPFHEASVITLDAETDDPYTLSITTLTGTTVRREKYIRGPEYLLLRNGLEKGCYLVELRGPVCYRGKIMIF